MRCEGWRRYGGAFTLGPVEWKQCGEEAVVTLEVVQDSEVATFPACMTCWGEAIDKGVEILNATPLVDE